MRNLLLISMILTLCPASLTQAEVGCMDNSWHLARAYDPKDYHYVACTCPCSRYQQFENRNTCSKCKHFHDPHPMIIIKPNPDASYCSNQRKKQVSWKTH